MAARRVLGRVRCVSGTGVTITLLPTASAPPYAEYMPVVADSGVKVVETAGRSPRDLMPIAKAAGIRIIHKCTAARHALSTELALIHISEPTTPY